jgi:hypothetical protein
MRRLLLWLAALLAGSASAQTVELQPSDAQQCLRHVDGEAQLPAYPIAEYNAATSGRLQVLLVFAQPDQAPTATVLLSEGGKAFEASVLQHVRGLRVPCMDARKGPVRLGKDFIFAAGQPAVAAAPPTDPDAARRAALLTCLVHPGGWKMPSFPEAVARMGLQGRVVVRARYTSPSEEPQVEVFARPYAKRLASEVRALMEKTRLPCLSGEPVTGLWTFIVMLEGDHFGFKELSFMQFLKSTKGVREQTLNFDTNTMACPFDVLLDYRQPELANGVAELGDPEPARQPLLAWMRRSELDVPRLTANSIWGDRARITIPCVKIDLKPKEKT